MSNRCPVCKAKLWKQPLLRHVECPRCGAEFRPTLSWEYFQLLLFFILFLCLSILALLSRNVFWFGILIIGLSAFIVWFLPKAIQLELHSTEAVPEGPVNREDLEYWEEDREEDPGWNPLVPIVLLLAVVAALIILMVGVIA